MNNNLSFETELKKKNGIVISNSENGIKVLSTYDNKILIEGKKYYYAAYDSKRGVLKYCTKKGWQLMRYDGYVFEDRYWKKIGKFRKSKDEWLTVCDFDNNEYDVYIGDGEIWKDENEFYLSLEDYCFKIGKTSEEILTELLEELIYAIDEQRYRSSRGYIYPYGEPYLDDYLSEDYYEEDI